MADEKESMTETGEEYLAEDHEEMFCVVVGMACTCNSVALRRHVA